MTRSLNALGKLNAALAGPKPNTSKYQNTSYPQGANGQSTNMFGVSTTASPTGGQRSQYPPLTNPKTEPYSPALGSNGILGVGVGSVGSGGIVMGPITPDSTGSSSDWNYGNMHERAAEYVQAPLWGEGGVGGFLG